MLVRCRIAQPVDLRVPWITRLPDLFWFACTGVGVLQPGDRATQGEPCERLAAVQGRRRRDTQQHLAGEMGSEADQHSKKWLCRGDGDLALYV